MIFIQKFPIFQIWVRKLKKSKHYLSFISFWPQVYKSTKKKGTTLSRRLKRELETSNLIFFHALVDDTVHAHLFL